MNKNHGKDGRFAATDAAIAKHGFGSKQHKAAYAADEAAMNKHASPGPSAAKVAPGPKGGAHATGTEKHPPKAVARGHVDGSDGLFAHIPAGTFGNKSLKQTLKEANDWLNSQDDVLAPSKGSKNKKKR